MTPAVRAVITHFAWFSRCCPSCTERARKGDGHARCGMISGYLRPRRFERPQRARQVRTPCHAVALTSMRLSIWPQHVHRNAPPARHRCWPKSRFRPSSSSEGDEIVGSRRAAEAGRLKSRFNFERLSPSRSPEGKAKRTRHGQQFLTAHRRRNAAQKGSHSCN